MFTICLFNRKNTFDPCEKGYYFCYFCLFLLFFDSFAISRPSFALNAFILAFTIAEEESKCSNNSA